MMYQTKYYGKTRDEIKEIGLSSENSKKLLLQLGIFGILRTVFLKRMESSVSALRTSLETYSKKLELFEKGIAEGKIVSLKDIEALELSFGDEDIEVDLESLEENTLDTIDEKSYELEILKQDLIKEKVWFYDMQSDGYTLDDRRSKIDNGGDLPDIVKRWRSRKNQTENNLSSKFFYVDKKDIEEADFDLSINRYKVTDYVEVQYESPKLILGKLEKLEQEILAGLSSLHNL
jgi:hypothetical protein